MLTTTALQEAIAGLEAQLPLLAEADRPPIEARIAELQSQLDARTADAAEASAHAAADAAEAAFAVQVRAAYEAAAPGRVSEAEWTRIWPDLLHEYRKTNMTWPTP